MTDPSTALSDGAAGSAASVRPRAHRLAAFLLALVAIGVLASGWVFHREQRQRLLEAAELALPLVAESKVDQIRAWRAGLTDEAAELMARTTSDGELAQALSTKPSQAAQQKALALFRILQSHHGYHDVVLVDAGGAVRLRLREARADAPDRISSETARALATAFHDRRPTLSEPEPEAGSDRDVPHLDAIAPLFFGDRPAGAVVLVTDLRDSLYPAIQPVGRGSRLLLARRDGDEVAFLNEVATHATLEPRVPLTRTELPAVMAATGRTGLVRGKDERGAEVLAVLSPVRDSQWFLVAELDPASALAGSRSRSLLLLLLLGSMAMVAGFAVWLWQGNERAREHALSQAETARHDSEESLARAQAIAHVGSWELDPASGTGSWSREMFQLTGFDPQRPAPTHDEFLEWAHPEDRDRLATTTRLAAAGEHQAVEVRSNPARGPVRRFLGTLDAVRDDEGRVVRLAGTLQDVTESKDTQDALRESERLYQELFFAHALPIWVYDRETLRFLAVNDAAVEHYGWSREQFLEMTIRDVRPAEELPRLEAEVARPGARPASEHTMGWRHQTRDGRILNVEISSHDISWRGREARVVVVHDVTERLRLEEQMRQAQKMEAVGRLAAGVAHDFNNLLGVIQGSAEMLLRDSGPGDAARHKLEQILNASRRSADLTRQLLALSRRQVARPVVLDLGTALAEAEPMLRRMIGEDVALSIQPGGHLGLVKADPGQIQQVLMNLAVNARDAMPQGGRLAIATEAVEIAEDQTLRGEPAIAAGRYVTLSVSDTGCGMDPATRACIFDPFFTTKPVGKGTGLGLTTVYGIVEQSGGAIGVETAPGAGTTFRIYLPRVEEPEQPTPAPPAAPARPAQPPRGDETILLVEDEALAREMLAEILRDCGYTVLEAADAAQALGLAQTTSGEIALLLTDVILPGPSGPELAAELRRARPRLRVLFVAAASTEMVTERGVTTSGAAFLEKPEAFVAATLAARVRALLDGEDDPESDAARAPTS